MSLKACVNVWFYIIDRRKSVVYNIVTGFNKQIKFQYINGKGEGIMAEKQFLTKKGYEERVAFLENLKVVRRKEVAQKLKEAREQGDLSENAEYDAAKDEQRDIEAQIVELENILKNAEIIQDNDKSKDKIKMESVVKLHDVEYDEDIEYTIVGSSEADSLNNKISNESPLGAALIGKKVGDTVKIEAPVGEIEYKIISVDND